jgi:hypothetical protein
MLATVVLGGVLAPAWALMVSPARQEIHVKPGEMKKVYLEVTNETQENQHVSVSSRDWFLLDANKKNKLTIDTWMQIKGKTVFNLNPNKKRRVKLILRCPKETEGELVGMVSFQYELKGTTMVTPIISASVYLVAEGTQKVSGEITKMDVRPWQGGLNVGATVKATGNVHVRPMGKILIEDDAGQSMTPEIPIPEGQPAYPGQERGYFNSIPNVTLKPGHYWVNADLVSGTVEMLAKQDFTVKQDGQIEMGQK